MIHLISGQHFCLLWIYKYANILHIYVVHQMMIWIWFNNWPSIYIFTLHYDDDDSWVLFSFSFTSIITFYDSNLIIKSGERERERKKMSNNIMFVFVCFVFWNKWVKFNWNLVNALCVCVLFFTCFSSLFNISLSCWINKLKQIKKLIWIWK